ncbi:MAG: glycoside hydrolase domain-containing protein, partial [Prolixibacteraceae bacterium]
DYNRKPDHWLVEVSGIPFGLSGQMLEGGGNPWRGMVYGITNRAGWTKNKPDYLWKFFDDYHFEQREMIGYWEKDCPVKTNNPELVVSVFKGSDDLVLAVGNWSGKNQTGSLLINWKNLGIKEGNAVFITPAVKDFQEEAEMNPASPIEIEGGKGIIVILKRK